MFVGVALLRRCWPPADSTSEPQGQSARLPRYAMTASTRRWSCGVLARSSLARMLATCVSTVRAVSHRRWAMPMLVRPSARFKNAAMQVHRVTAGTGPSTTPTTTSRPVGTYAAGTADGTRSPRAVVMNLTSTFSAGRPPGNVSPLTGADRRPIGIGTPLHGVARAPCTQYA